MREYLLDLTDKQWEEVECLGFEPFIIERRQPLTRGQIMAIAEMCVGKACRIEAGDYGPNDEEVDTVRWAAELRAIADSIFARFKPGDGQV